MEMKINTKGKLWVDIAASAVWCLFVLIVTGCSFALMNPVRTVILILGFAGFSYLILKNEGAGKEARITAVVTILAIGVRTLYVLYTGAGQRQHDVAEFDAYYGLNYHSEYIEYLLENHRLLNEDIREHYQFYHPPLTHIASAVFFGIYRKIAPSYAHNWDALQSLSLFYSLVTLAILKKFTGLWNLSPKGKTVAYLTVALLPQFIYFAGALNNDPLAVLFAVASLYLALVWYNDEKKSFLKLMGMSLCIGLGMMAKLSAGLIAVPIAFIMIKAFFESKTKLRMFFEYVAFLAVCAPLGLWYQVRNYILWKVPFTFVARPDVVENPQFLVAPMPFWNRFLAFGDDVDYNIITETLYSACFDDEYYRDYMPLALIGYFLLAAFTVLVITMVLNFIFTWIKERSMMNLVMTILLVSQLASYVIFCFDYPYTCTMAFRYIVPTIVAGAYYSGKSMDKAPHLMGLITKGAVYAVAIFSFILYCLAWLLDFRTA
jgi:4-amino-4-deoxy-L-arabinose transferase-like glycosyltransferase